MNRLLLFAFFLALASRCAADVPRTLAGRLLHIQTTTAGFEWQLLVELQDDGKFRELLSTYWSHASFYTWAPKSGSYTYSVSADQSAVLTFLSGGSTMTYEFSFISDSEGYFRDYNKSVYTHRLHFFGKADGDGVVNVSNRSWISGERSSISGFIISGDRPRLVLIRAVGPGLIGMSVESPVKHPELAMYSGSQRVQGFHDFHSYPDTSLGIASISASVGAFPLAEGSADFVSIVLLAPGAYTLMCSSGAETGEALVEVYQLPWKG